jgi:hypothetical protein
MSKKVKLISDTIKLIVFAALNAIEKFFISRIPVERVRTGMTILLSPIRQMVTALNDQDPENGEQVEALWKKFANTDLADYSENTLDGLIGNIKDNNLRPALATIVKPTVGMLRIVTDQDPDNEAQIKAQWKGFIEDPSVHKVVLDHMIAPTLYGMIKNKELVEYILATIADLLDGEGQKEEAAALRVQIVEFKNAA